jgi:hypothetical protein
VGNRNVLGVSGIVLILEQHFRRGFGPDPLHNHGCRRIVSAEKKKDDKEKKKHFFFNGANLWAMLLLLINAEWQYRLNRSAPSNVISAIAGCPSRDWHHASQATLIRLGCRLHPEQVLEADPSGNLPLHFAAAARMAGPTAEDLEVDKQNEWMNQHEEWEGEDPTRCNRELNDLEYLEEELLERREELLCLQEELLYLQDDTRAYTRAHAAAIANTAAIKVELDDCKGQAYELEREISILKAPVCDCSFCKDQRYPFKDLRNKEAIQVLLEISPDAAKCLNHRGDLPLHIAIATRKTWTGGIKDLVNNHPQSLATLGSAKLLPFQMAAVQNITDQCSHMNSVNTVFELLRACPTVLKPDGAGTSVAAKDIKSTRKGKRKRTSKFAKN